MQTQEIRRQFLNYFKKQQHHIIHSSSVVPIDDPSLLFVNAGMNQFKDVFLGKSIRDYRRATSSQKCIRVGGKHNDLENVGHTRRHLTFFEMLGNFSFGDYFKVDAIRFAWEVSTQIFGFEPERIWPTVFREDDEAFEIWKHYVPENRISRFDEKDNFWAMGDTGPCGPCSELLYDRGSKYGSANIPKEDKSGERFLEFWNLVFMQYNRQIDGTLESLPKPSIDTGAGLERVMSLKMNVDNVFETDILRGVIAQIEQISKISYQGGDLQRDPAFRVIADHLRCLSFAIADGIQPSNVDRGYVLRKVLRRAVRYGRSLNFQEPFLAKILPSLVSMMGEDFKELKDAESRIAEILTNEEEAFFRTLHRGGNILNTIIDKAHAHDKKISGDDAFKLKDTYGLPFEEIHLLAKDASLTVDIEKFQQLEKEARERSRNVHKVTQQIAAESLYTYYLENHPPTEFLGYDHVSINAKVKALIVNEEFVKEIQEGQEGFVILDKTPFYPEMGGQIGDTGFLDNQNTLFKVSDTQVPYKGAIIHLGRMERGILKLGDQLTASIDLSRRQKIANNHTATHLLHWALHKVLGEHVKQAGSIVGHDRLRFDFSHHKALTMQEIYKIEDLINDKVRQNTGLKRYEIPYEDAQKNQEIKQFFGEKYGSLVRVVAIGQYSKELCGGTHTDSTGTIGLFRIVKESSIAAGIRRIEAATGMEAELFDREQSDLLNELALSLKCPVGKIQERVEKLIQEHKGALLELKITKKNQLIDLAHSLTKKIEVINTIPLLVAQIDVNPEEMRIIGDEIMNKWSTGVLILASNFDNKCHMITRVSNDLTSQGINAIEIIKVLAPMVQGTGGGKANSAQAGGKAPENITEALTKAKELF